MNNKQSEYNRNYYIQNREKIIQKRIKYYRENKEIINEKHKIYYAEYYQNNKKEIIKRVQNNYFLKIHAIKEYKPPIIPKNQILILENNIVINLME